MANRYSTYSAHSNGGQNRTNTMRSGTMQGSNVSQQVSTTSLLAQLNTCFASQQPYPLEASTSLVVNTWASGNVVDEELARKAWEHARRRAEDGCILLGSLHRSSPSLLPSFTGALPLAVPHSFFIALNALKPFLHRVTPYNPSLPCYSALSATFTLSMEGEIQGAALSLSTSGIDTKNALLDVPSEQGHRAFDVFYYLLTSATAKEREFLGLKSPNQYTLLRKSETYTAPSYLPTADDAAAAEDWRENLKALGVKGADFRNLLTVVASILRLGDAVGFLVDQEELESTCEEVGSMLDIDPDVLLKKCVTEERELLIGGIYEAVVDWVIIKLNNAIRSEMRNGQQIGSSSGSDTGMHTPPSSQDDAVSASITVVEVPQQTLAKAVSLKTVFDDQTGINAEMKEDGVQYVPAGSSVMREMKDAVAACEADLDINGGALAREREVDLDRRQTALEKVGVEAESDSFLRRILYPVSGADISLGKTGRFNLRNTMESSRVWFHLCLHPSDDNPASFAQNSLPWSAGSVSSQIRAWRLPEWANHRNKQLDFTADFDIEEFVDRYARLGCQGGREGVEAWIMERGWSNGDVVVGSERIWIREAAWWEAESMLDMKPMDEMSPGNMLGGMVGAGGLESGYSMQAPSMTGSGFFNQFEVNDSKDSLQAQHMSQAAPSQFGVARSVAPTTKSKRPGDYGLGPKGDIHYDDVTYEGELDPELAAGKEIVVQKTTFGRRVWVAATWAFTFWIPSPALKHIGRMKRPDVRLAWREKLLLMFIIFFLNACIVFYIIFFGKLLCPKWDKAWNTKEVSYHQGEDDYYVSFRGGVYDLTKFWKLQHSDTNIDTTQDLMLPFAGTDVSAYIVPPLWLACPGLVENTPTNAQLKLQSNTTLLYPQAEHVSGSQTPDPGSALSNDYWYTETFLPKMEEMYKGQLVFKRNAIKKQGEDDGTMRFIIDKKVYDLTSYFYTVKTMDNLPQYSFFAEDVETLMQSNPGGDITKEWEEQLNYTTRTNSLNCLDNMFHIGDTDFRDSPRCQVNNYILLAFMILLCTVIGVKFLAALQLGSKRRPAQQDKFVICQVPAYTEGEDQLRKGLDSLTALAYDNKRKLICVICDGMIVGGGNDRPTPKIVLDILGVDPKIDPPALPFKSVGAGSEQLNYGKVYSGLYEYEGNVVPYIVVVKVGKESEQRKSKPGNRGKRDSQILLMSFLNRVHHRAPMSPLELEMFHQINNIIGVDPELYEYLFMVDADTKVKEDSLNRLVASCANDGKIAGICGETSLENEEGSWWTMIQVYEYYISHHLAKAFESLFGSVTCLPGCFCMYRLRTADKGRPLIISDKVIKEYADNNIDTLHKKNLLSLGEDRYLTTLMTKHFPSMSYKFVPDAYALTEAPAEWSVLLSQRRRWINSTIHNLAELMFIKNLCGFCCFSMRFVVFIDLIGTILLPSVCIYLGYLIYLVASKSGQFPLISIIMIAAVYGLQAIIFIIKRQWQHIGWMVIYIMAYPIYSFILPIYSFWKQDDFSWGNTRIVIGERGDKKVIAADDEGFDPRSIPLQRWDDYALANSLPGRRGVPQEKEDYYGGGGAGYEMDDMHSVYSSAKPASTILTGFPQHQSGMYTTPQSPGPGMMQRQSTWSHMSGRYTDNPNMTAAGAPQDQQQQQQQQRLMSMGGMSDRYASGARTPAHQSRDNLLSTGAGAGMQSPPLYQDRSRSPLQQSQIYSRPGSTNALNNASSNHLSGFQHSGPTNEAITMAIRECLGEVDLDNVTKKQLKALAEQKLQCQLVGERRQFLDGQIDFELASM